MRHLALPNVVIKTVVLMQRQTILKERNIKARNKASPRRESCSGDGSVGHWRRDKLLSKWCSAIGWLYGEK